MKRAPMSDFGLGAELFPDFDRASYLGGDVVRNVCLFVAILLRVPMLVLLAGVLAGGVVMVLPEVERVNAADASMNQA